MNLTKFILTGFLVLVFQGFSDAEVTIAPQVCHTDQCVTVEVVSTPEDMERGLMYRKGLEQDHGMLFVFTEDDRQAFWMKNMQFSLDILWIGADGRIVYIVPNIPACISNPCPAYAPDQDARYVLELSSGYVASHHWKLGDKLDLKGIFKM